MPEQLYLMVRVRMSMYDMMTLPYPAQDAVLCWLMRHGIDVTKEFSYMDEPGGFYRVFTQRHTKEQNNATHAATPTDTQS